MGNSKANEAAFEPPLDCRVGRGGMERQNGATHDRCHWNCGGTACDAPKRPPRKDGPAINLAYYAGSYGGTTPTKPRQRIDLWLAALEGYVIRLPSRLGRCMEKKGGYLNEP